MHDHYLVPSDAGMNYHVLYDDGPLPPVQIYPADAYHDLVDSGPLPATQVYPNDCFHLNVVSPTDLTLVHDHYLVMSDAGMNYHDNVVSPTDLTLVHDHYLVISDAGMNYHDNVVDPTDLTLVELGAIDLVMTDGGAHHDNVVTPTDLALIIPLVITDAGMNYHDNVVTPTDLTLVHDHYLVISDAGVNFHLNVVTPTDLTLAHDHYLVMSDAGMNYHVLYDDGPLPATQVYPDDCYHLNVVDPTNLTLVETGDVTLTMSDGGMNYHVNASDNVRIDPAWVYAGECYHDHIVTPTDLPLVEIHELTITPDPYHDLITKDEVWFIQQAVPELLSIPDYLTLGITHILTVDACFHEIDDGVPLTLVQKFTLVLSDAGVNYHAHVVIPTDINLAGVVDLTMTDGGAAHDTVSAQIDLIAPLAVAGCYHDHAAENVTLVQDHYLADLDTYHVLTTPAFGVAEIVEGMEDVIDMERTLWPIKIHYTLREVGTERTLNKI